MESLRTILVGVDFTAGSAAALREAIRIAQWKQAQIEVLHVIDTLVVVQLEEMMSPMVQGIQTELVAEAKSHWERFSARIEGAAGLPFHVGVNNAAYELVARVKDKKTDLLVLGAHGDKKGRGVSTLGADCVRRANSKVMLVRDSKPGPFKRIVACIDFSETSRLALEQAVAIAAQDDAHVHAVHVVKMPGEGFSLFSSKKSVSETDRARYREQLRTRLEEFCKPTDPQVVWARPRFELIEHSNHGQGIAEYVEKSDADLVVLGTRGRTNIRDLVLGSTAERVLRDATCSVLTVRPTA